VGTDTFADSASESLTVPLVVVELLGSSLVEFMEGPDSSVRVLVSFVVASVSEE